MRRALPALAAAAIAAVAQPAPAEMSHLGGFHPVASEEGARAVWVNPAAIGTPPRPSTCSEFVWIDSDETESGVPDGMRFFNYSAASDRASLGFQWEYDDVSGVADWTISWGKPIPISRRIIMGTTLEWKAGEDDKLDATVGTMFPLGRNLRVAVVVRDVFEAEVDGAETSRLWQAGGSVRSQKLLGGLTYDFVSLEDSGDSEHWFGIAIDRARHLRLSYALEANGDWSGEGGFARGDLFLGGGVTERDGAPRTIFASVEWTPPPPRGRRGLKAISR